MVKQSKTPRILDQKILSNRGFFAASNVKQAGDKIMNNDSPIDKSFRTTGHLRGLKTARAGERTNAFRAQSYNRNNPNGYSLLANRNGTSGHLMMTNRAGSRNDHNYRRSTYANQRHPPAKKPIHRHKSHEKISSKQPNPSQFLHAHFLDNTS